MQPLEQRAKSQALAIIEIVPHELTCLLAERVLAIGVEPVVPFATAKEMFLADLDGRNALTALVNLFRHWLARRIELRYLAFHAIPPSRSLSRHLPLHSQV